jgi:zinc transport system substrate-binding protein
MKRFFGVLLALVLCGSLFAGCAGEPQQPQNGAQREAGLKIVATIFPHYDFARAVAGEAAEVSMLLRPGAESHSFDPSPADIMAIQNADMFIYTGGHNDAWVDSVLGSIDTSGITVLRMMNVVNAVEEELPPGVEEEGDGHDLSHEEERDRDHGEGHSHEGGAELDEHIWTSPKNAAAMVEAVAKAMIEKDAANAGVYRANADAYIEEIEALNADFEAVVQAAQHKLIVVADRFPFRYFCDEYGIEYKAAFPGCSTDSNPSAGTVANLVDTVREYEIPYIFTIELSTGSIASVISGETGRGVLTLHSCHGVTRDEFESGATYVTLMRQNVENLGKGMV